MLITIYGFTRSFDVATGMTIRYYFDIGGRWVPHARYALSVVLELIGARGVSCNQAGEADLVYSYKRPENLRSDALWIRAEESGNWHDPSPLVSTFDGLRILSLGSSPEPTGDRNACNADLLYSSYGILTGILERSQRRDQWGVIICADSTSMREGLLQRPVVAEYARYLKLRFERIGVKGNWLPLWPDGKSFAIVLTHDVDDPFSYSTAWYYARRLRRVHVSRGPSTFAISGIGAIKQTLLSLLGKLPDLGQDKNLGFEMWREMEGRLRAHGTFYVATRSSAEFGTDARDVRYDFSHPLIADALRRAVDSGWEVSLHASINAKANDHWIIEERQRLERILTVVSIPGVRHHYWALDAEIPERTLWQHVDAGFAYDSSFGLNDEIGFRRGMVHPYDPFDPERNKTIPIIEVPCTLMDGGIFYKVISVEDATRALESHVRQVASAHGAVVLDWHIDKFNNIRTPGAIESLRNVLFSYAADNGVYWASAIELAEWWKKRRMALAEGE